MVETLAVLKVYILVEKLVGEKVEKLVATMVESKVALLAVNLAVL